MATPELPYTVPKLVKGKRIETVPKVSETGPIEPLAEEIQNDDEPEEPDQAISM